MKVNLLPDISKWTVAYSPYVDTLHAYSIEGEKRKPDQLIEREIDGSYVLLDSKTYKPLLFEMKLASTKLSNIAKMSKRDIIRTIEVYIND